MEEAGRREVEAGCPAEEEVKRDAKAGPMERARPMRREEAEREEAEAGRKIELAAEAAAAAIDRLLRGGAPAATALNR